LNIGWTIVEAAVLVGTPLAAWYAVPALNRALGNPFFFDSTERQPFWRRYWWLLTKVTPLVLFCLALFSVWVIALLGLVSQFVSI
jgi:hypothetical protein